jgi:hypothetical protein
MMLESLWRAYHGDTPPLGWRLREDEKSRWVRFHSLPESKRYAENQSEVSTILHRQNRIADIVLGPESVCWIVACFPTDVSDTDTWMMPFRSLRSRFTMVRQWTISIEEDEMTFDVYAAPVRWRSGGADRELTEIADDKVRALWISEATGAILAPYDGGVDCIMPTPAQTVSLRGEFSSWLSPHPRGL